MAVISIPSPSSSPRSRSRKRKRIPAAAATAAASSSRWRTDRARRIYTATLLSSLRRLRLSSSSSSARAVRAAADRSLAASARGTSLWSRSILSSSGVSRGKKVRPGARAARPRRPARTDRPARPGAVEGRARALGRVVPGCRKLALPSLLDETADYIAALEMQVRAMTIIADILSAAAPSSSSSPS